MRKNILTDEIDPTDIVRVKITKEPETGWYIGKVDTEYDCVYDHKGNFMLVEDVKAVKDGNSFTTRIIKPDDVEIVVVISTPEKVEVKEVDNSPWINVKDRLPEESGDYIIYGRFTKDCPRSVNQSHYIKKQKRFQTIGIYAKDVTHWQPLPSPPTH